MLTGLDYAYCSQEDWQPWCRDQTSLLHLLTRSLTIVSLICCRLGLLSGTIFHFPSIFHNISIWYSIKPFLLSPPPAIHSLTIACLFNLLTSQSQTQWNHNPFSIWFWTFCICHPINVFSCKISCNVLAENSNRHCALNQHIFKKIVSYLYICVLMLYLEAC